MNFFKILLLGTLSFSAYAESSCHVSTFQGLKLLAKLKTAKKILILPNHEMNCSNFRLERNLAMRGSSNKYIEAECNGKVQSLALEKLYISHKQNVVAKLDEKNFCMRNIVEVKDSPETTNKSALEEQTPKIAPTCSLKDSWSSECYYKRDKAELKVGLLYYGTYWGESDINRFKSVFEERFNKATRGEITIEVVKTKVLPFQRKMPQDYSFNGITDLERLQRIWYWENVNYDVAEEMYSEFVRTEENPEELESLDFLLGVTGAQSEGNGFQSGNIVVIEQPRELFWNRPGGGRFEELSDHEAADILIHEMGHGLGIGHASEQCTERNLPYNERYECCKQSPSGNDVMSYCRDRSKPTVNYFQSCTLDIIKNKIRPNLLNGGPRRIEAIKCE